MLASDTIELGEDITLFTSCFELVSILKNCPYYYDLIVLDKKNQAHYELQVLKHLKKLSIFFILVSFDQIISKAIYPISESANFAANLKKISGLDHANILKIVDVRGIFDFKLLFKI